MSNKTLARIGGVLYLINIVVGFFSIGYVGGVIDVPGDAAATARNILSHESLYRLGFAGHVLILLTNIPLAVIFYELFKLVNRRVAMLVVFFTLVGTAIEAVNLLNQFAPLILLKGNFGDMTGENLQSFVNLFPKLEGIGFNLALVFFGFYGLCIGYLIIRSNFMPRLIGGFMLIGGSCYVFNSFANFLAPSFARHLFPYLQLPSGLAELSFCLFMLIVGVRTRRGE